MGQINLNADERSLIRAIAHGDRLMDHRDIEGRKWFALHNPDGASTPVDDRLVHGLIERGLISSNKKFPAATYWLTDRAHAASVVATHA